MWIEIVFLTSIFQEKNISRSRSSSDPRLLGWLQGGVVAANSVLAGELSFHSYRMGERVR
jgi:hypothetical protein